MESIDINGFILSEEFSDEQIEDLFFEFLDKYGLQFIGIIDNEEEE